MILLLLRLHLLLLYRCRYHHLLHSFSSKIHLVQIFNFFWYNKRIIFRYTNNKMFVFLIVDTAISNPVFLIFRRNIKLHIMIGSKQNTLYHPVSMFSEYKFQQYLYCNSNCHINFLSLLHF